MEREMASLEKFIYEANHEPDEYDITDNELERWEEEVHDIWRRINTIKGIIGGVEEAFMINKSEVMSSNEWGEDNEYDETWGLTSEQVIET